MDIKQEVLSIIDEVMSSGGRTMQFDFDGSVFVTVGALMELVMFVEHKV